MPKRFVRRHQPPSCRRSSLKAGIGAALAIAVVAWLGEQSGMPLLIAPFGASCVLLFAVPESPLSQPANVVGGHLLATGISLAVDAALPHSLWSMVLAFGLVIAAMSLLRLVHPPAGADPLLVMSGHPGWTFLFTPVLAGAVALVLIAWVVHRLPPVRSYPLPAREMAD